METQYAVRIPMFAESSPQFVYVNFHVYTVFLINLKLLLFFHGNIYVCPNFAHSSIILMISDNWIMPVISALLWNYRYSRFISVNLVHVANSLVPAAPCTHSAVVWIRLCSGGEEEKEEEETGQEQLVLPPYQRLYFYI